MKCNILLAHLVLISAGATVVSVGDTVSCAAQDQMFDRCHAYKDTRCQESVGDQDEDFEKQLAQEVWNDIKPKTDGCHNGDHFSWQASSMDMTCIKTDSANIGQITMNFHIFEDCKGEPTLRFFIKSGVCFNVPYEPWSMICDF